MFQGLSVEAEKRSAWKDGLEPRRNLQSLIQRHSCDFMSSSVSARKLSTFWVSGEPEEGWGVGERSHREGTKIVPGWTHA